MDMHSCVFLRVPDCGACAWAEAEPCVSQQGAHTRQGMCAQLRDGGYGKPVQSGGRAGWSQGAGMWEVEEGRRVGEGAVPWEVAFAST